MALEDKVNTLLDWVEMLEKDLSDFELAREDYPSSVYRVRRDEMIGRIRETKKQLKNAYLELLNAEWLEVSLATNYTPAAAAYNMARTAYELGKRGWDFKMAGGEGSLIWREEI